MLLRTRQLDVGFWIDEGLSVGIADRPIGDIPGVLRQDGSPPLYYLLLNVWLHVVGRSEADVHGLSVLLAVLCVPVAWWGGKLLFGTRTAWIAALLAAVNPFMTQYAQEGRMYSMVTLLGLISLICWLHAFTSDPPEGGGVRRAPAIGFAVAFAAMLYTHNWALFFGAATGLVWLWLLWRAGPEERRRQLRTALVGLRRRGPALRCRGSRTRSTRPRTPGRRGRTSPSLAALASVPARMWGKEAELAIVLVAGTGALALWRGRGPRARAVVALLVIAVATFVLAWLASQLSPAWANRYLAAGVAPFLLLAAAGFGAAGRLGLAGLAIVAVLWAIDGAPDEKSNVREVSEAIAPSLRPGRPRRGHPARAGLRAPLLPARGPALRDAHRRRARRRRDGLARRRRAAGAHQRRARPRPAARHRAARRPGRRSSSRRSTTSASGARRGPRSCASARRSGSRSSTATRASPAPTWSRRRPSSGCPYAVRAEVFVRR